MRKSLQNHSVGIELSARLNEPISLRPRIMWALDARKSVFGGKQTTKAQTSLRIRAVWSAPLLFAYCKLSFLDVQAKILFSS